MIRHSNLGVWCDYCKVEWGKLKSGEWHANAKRQALITITSESGAERHYCRSCMDLVSAWPDGTSFTMVAQVTLGKSEQAERAAKRLAKLVANV
jgi:hypothetical protein